MIMLYDMAWQRSFGIDLGLMTVTNFSFEISFHDTMVSNVQSLDDAT
jgi:hypothetical protein